MFYNRQNLLKTINRRSFFLRAGLVTSGIMLSGCFRKFTAKNDYSHIAFTLGGPDAKAGHTLRDKTPLPPPTEIKNVKTLIIGSGISGLSAARWLKNNGHSDFEVLELENHIGGNSHSGKNETSSYPFGAHYVTIANNNDTHLLDFFEEAGLITHFENQLPFYNEYYLCFDPEERLLINGQWQEGLIPEFGITLTDRQQLDRFFMLMDDFKQAKGVDGKFAFDIPLQNSSTDSKFKSLDQISFQKFLQNQSFTSPYLLWYLNYCCKDDYGQKSDKISAWAGIHYFASRKGRAANAESNAVLTWPEGNGWLMKKLAEKNTQHISRSSLCYQLEFIADDKISANVLHTKTGKTTSIIAEKVILATPQFVNQKLLAGIKRNSPSYEAFNYSPWFIANITLNQIPTAKGLGLSWDNVAYGTPSVGYVNANQQHLTYSEDKKVITYYLPLCDYESRVARLAAYTRTPQQWLEIVMPELEFMHPGIAPFVETIDAWIWGHGMIAPQVNFIWGDARKQATEAIDGKIFFAHTDLSGISIFEEAFHQGINAAKAVIASYGNA